MTEFESIMLAACFGISVGTVIGNLITVIGSLAAAIKQRRKANHKSCWQSDTAGWAGRSISEVYMEISTFNNEEFGEIRTIQENGEVLFCGADIAKALGYSNTRDALSRHCKGVVKCDTPTNGGIQSLGFISEGNVYRLIAHSKLPGAERFEKWVFDEVLPSIRKNGAYMTEDVLEQALASPDFLIELATRLKTEKAKNAQLTVSNQIMQPKADYFDMLVDRNLLTGIRDTAKELGVRQNDFVRFLLDKGYLYRSKKGKLRPYATYVDSGLFEMKEFVNDKTGYTDTQTMITPKGKETFRLLCI